MNEKKRRYNQSWIKWAALGLVPAALVATSLLVDARQMLWVSLALIALSFIPFLLRFERRKPRAREIVTIAVLCALAVAGRAAFFMAPQCKPLLAIVIIAGVCFGAETGFMTGALAVFVSNFFFGQGPWTPWQMFACGLIGFLAGVLFARRGRKPILWLCLFGGVAAFAVYGPIVDIASVLFITPAFSLEAALAVLAASIPFNAVHAAATVVFLALLAHPMLGILARLKKKFALLEADAKDDG